MTDVHIDQHSRAQLIHDWSADLTTRTGLNFHVRPAEPGDDRALEEFFRHVRPEDLRFRFLTAVRKVGEAQISSMTHVDHISTENFLAFVPGDPSIIATAMLAANPTLDTAEVAMSIREDLKGKGISWTLLTHVARYARARGIRKLQSIESRENHAAINLETEMGFIAKPYPGDSCLVLVEANLNP